MLRAVRDGKKAPYECPECGCRLRVFETTYIEDGYSGAIHFLDDKDEQKLEYDAKGHKCSKIGVVWTVK